jgi:hypothetical protein
MLKTVSFCLGLIFLTGCVGMMDVATGQSSKSEYNFIPYEPLQIKDALLQAYPDVDWRMAFLSSRHVQVKGGNDFDGATLVFTWWADRSSSRVDIYVWKNYLSLDAGTILSDLRLQLSKEPSDRIEVIAQSDTIQPQRQTSLSYNTQLPASFAGNSPNTDEAGFIALQASILNALNSISSKFQFRIVNDILIRTIAESDFTANTYWFFPEAYTAKLSTRKEGLLGITRHNVSVVPAPLPYSAWNAEEAILDFYGGIAGDKEYQTEMRYATELQRFFECYRQHISIVQNRRQRTCGHRIHLDTDFWAQYDYVPTKSVGNTDIVYDGNVNEQFMQCGPFRLKHPIKEMRVRIAM